MRIAAIVLCGATMGLVIAPALPGMGQSSGPPADKIDTNPVDTGKTDAQPSPPAAPDTAPPPPEPAQKPADSPAPGETVEAVAPAQAISILGKKVMGPDGKAILGSVIDMLVDADGKPRAAVIDFGGFLGVGSRHVAIDWNTLKFHLDIPAAPVELDLDPEQIKAAPEYRDVNANAEVVEPALSSPTPLPESAPLAVVPIPSPLTPFKPQSAKNAGQ